MLTIHGGKPLSGEVVICGAKNAITKLLVASMISEKRSIFFNVPPILEVEVTLELCRAVGMQATWDRALGVIECITPEITQTDVPQTFSGANRIPILLLGTLLGRTKKAVSVPAIGGCHLGRRPVDFHIYALTRLGALIEIESQGSTTVYHGSIPHRLTGGVIDLPYPSVGATENAILAACQAEGHSEIRNCALEPELCDLLLFLQKIGVEVWLEAGRTIHVKGCKTFFPAEHEVMFDRVEAASFAMAAIGTQGRIKLSHVRQEPLMVLLNRLREIGAGVKIERDGIECFYQGPLKGGIHLETDTYPGFLTDWQPPFATLLTQADGISVIHETVFDHRFSYVKTLSQLGADLTLSKHCLGNKPCRFSHRGDDHSLVIRGPTPLHPGDVTIPDLRAGFAYVMAALISEGTSRIFNPHFLDRGYAHLETRLASLGAHLHRTTLKEAVPCSAG